MEKKNKVGRPNELGPSLEKAKDYLSGGYESVGEVVPTVAGLACWLGKSRTAVYDYASKSVDFSYIVEGILSMQETKLIAGGLKGDFNPTIAKLLLSKHGYSDRQEITGLDGAPLAPTKIELVAANGNSEDTTPT